MVGVVVSAAAAAAVVNFLFEAWIGQKEACQSFRVITYNDV